MSIVDNENTAVITTEIKNGKGELLIKVTREYGAAITAAEALSLETQLIAIGTSSL